MADIDDQNTPNDDFSQSIDGESAEVGSAADDLKQQPDINGDSSESDPLSALGSDGADKEIHAQDSAELGENASHGPVEHEWDDSTLTGRLERKLSEANEVLWEKEGLQMQFTFGDHIREEYYKRWKGEGNAFLILAARLRRRLEKERAKVAKSS